MAIFCMVWLCSCTVSSDEPMPEKPSPLGKGFYILNYGLENGEGSSLDFYSIDSNRMHRDIFGARNNAEVGKGLKDIVTWRQYALFTAEKSSAIWVINSATAKIAGRYALLREPGNIVVVDAEKTYLSSTAQEAVHVMQTAALQPVGNILLPQKAARMVLGQNKLFVLPAYSVSMASNTIYVIDALFDKLLDSIQLPGFPSGAAFASDGTLWVLCAGSEDGQSALVAIDASSYTLQKTYALPQFNPESAGFTSLHDDFCYVLCGDVYIFRPNAPDFSPEQIIAAQGRHFTAILSDTISGRVYLTGQRSGTYEGYLYRFEQQGLLIDSVRTGLRPVALAFN